MLIKGIDVLLYEKQKIGTDGFNHSIYAEAPTVVHDILVAPLTVQEALETTNLIGKKAVYQIAIPKGDTHEWEDHRVRFFNADWVVVGYAKEGIDANIPLRWNKIYQVAKYE